MIVVSSAASASPAGKDGQRNKTAESSAVSCEEPENSDSCGRRA